MVLSWIVKGLPQGGRQTPFRIYFNKLPGE